MLNTQCDLLENKFKKPLDFPNLINTIVLGLTFRYTFRNIKQANRDNVTINEESIYATKAIMGGVMSFVLFICFTSMVGNMATSVTKIVNPEYYVVQDFIRIIMLKTLNINL
jgi:hypothetical protein